MITVMCWPKCIILVLEIWVLLSSCRATLFECLLPLSLSVQLSGKAHEHSDYTTMNTVVQWCLGAETHLGGKVCNNFFVFLLAPIASGSYPLWKHDTMKVGAREVEKRKIRSMESKENPSGGPCDWYSSMHCVEWLRHVRLDTPTYGIMCHTAPLKMSVPRWVFISTARTRYCIS